MNGTAVFTNMCMVCGGNGNVLVQNRVKSWRGLAFPGGHVEKLEPFYDSVIREVYEETGLTIENPKLCGIKWYGDYDEPKTVVFLYRADKFSGELVSSDEGEMIWTSLEKPRSGDTEVPLAKSMDLMLDLFLRDDVNEMFWNYETDRWDFR